MTQEQAFAELYALIAKPGGEVNVAGVQQQIVQAVSPAAIGTETSSTGSRVSDQLTVITQQMDLLNTVQQAQADSMVANTKALSENTASRIGSAVVTAAKDTASSFLGGFGLSPIVSGLLQLFGGGSSAPAPAPIAKYAAPDSIQLNAGLSGGQVSAVDYGVGDQVRAVGPAPTAVAVPTTHVTVQVTAMDSRSFLDHSDEIAKAVRLAMLESHGINDVVAEL